MKYFDYAASCPLDEEAVQVYVKASTNYFGNSSSLHDIGSGASQLLENCRKELANIIGVEKEGIYFTSGGSESNFLAIQALLSTNRKKGNHIIAGMAEHSSIQSTLNKLEEDGYKITYIPFLADGTINTELLSKSIMEDTVLVTVQHANPEIGSIQPLEDIVKRCKEEGILFHSDCVQSFGKIDLKTISNLVDSLSISGHKFYGPKGTGAVYINPRLGWKSYYPGASHESGFRPGTVNVPAIASMTVAAQKAYRLLQENAVHFQELRQYLLERLKPYEDKITVYDLTDTNKQIASTLGMRIHGIEGQMVMLECNRFGYAISTGSACQSGMHAPSKTMKAMNIEEKSAKEFIRISFGWNTKKEDVDGLANTLIKIIVSDK